MNFSERFKGKTSIMTKEGLSALVRSSKLPVHKRSYSPELTPIEESRPIKSPPSFLASAAVSNNSTNRQSHFQEKQGFPKHPPTWPPTVSSQIQSQSPTLLSIPSHRPVLTQNSTPLRSRNGLLPNWDSRSGITETEPVLPSSMVLTGLNRGVKMNANEFMPSITLLEERMPTRSRAQSTIRERTPTVNDQFQPKISPDRDNILKPVQRIRVQKRGFTRLSPLRASVLDSEGIVNVENQEPYRERQFASQEDPNIIRRSTSHREFKDSQSQSPAKSRLPTRSLQRPRQEENMIPKLVEANIARYLDHLSDLVTKNKETFSYQDQRLHLKSYDRGRDFRSGPLNTLDSYRIAQSPAPKTDTNGKAKRIETRVTFKNDDIIDYVISQPQGKVYRSNSNEPFGRRHFEELLREERGESPFRKLTRRRVSKVENS